MRRTLPTLTMLLLLAASVAVGEVIDRVLAIVNSHLITLSDVRASIALGLVRPEGDEPTESALQQWIDRVLVLEEVERYAPPEPAQADVDAAVEAAIARAGGPERFRAALETYGFDEGWVRQWIRADLRTQSYIEQRFAGTVLPTEEDLENYYRQHPEEFVRDGREITGEEAQQLARERVIAERRAAVVRDWIEGLRRRASILRPTPDDRRRESAQPQSGR